MGDGQVGQAYGTPRAEWEGPGTTQGVANRFTEMGGLREVVYTPRSELRAPLAFFRRIARDVWGSRELARSLLIRNVKGQYRQTALGYLWAVLPPLATTLTFVFLHAQRILASGETTVPYPVYVLVGSLLWQVFVDAVNNPLRLVQASTSMMASVNFPREAILFAGLGEVLFYFFIRILLLVPVFALWGTAPSWSILYFPIGLLAIMALGWGIGLLLVPVGILYKDVEMGLGILVTLWFFITPVVYTPPASGTVSLLVRFNPMSPLLNGTRDLLTGGAMASLGELLFLSLLSVAFLLLGWIVFRLAIPHIVKILNA